jgi:5-methylcytosine-specific restriction endonuclease McrA
VLASCLTGTADSGLRTRLRSIKANLVDAGKAYQANAALGSLNLIPRVNSVGAVTKAELTGLYETHLSKARGAARAVYDRIRNAAPNNRCPLCGVGNVAHCDHHLPKSHYPDLSILPVNLVPACHFCNDRKHAKFPKTAGQQTFHPYFDEHLLADTWVRATLHPGPPPALVFDAAPPQTWSPINQERVRRHFDACGLAITFTTNANDELPILRDRLKLQASHGGTMAVQQFLNEERGIHSSRRNSWQFATYSALACHPWFVSGGYLTIP